MCCAVDLATRDSNKKIPFREILVMSVVGELPVDVSGPPRFSSAQFEFDLKKCGHSRQPSHRRTASRVMMYYDENFLDFGLEPQRPGTPTAAAGQAHNPFADILAKEEISWGKVEEVEGLPTRPILTRSSIRSSEGSSMKGGDRPDVEELFGKHWAGLARGSGSLGSSQGTPKSVRCAIGWLIRILFRIFIMSNYQTLIAWFSLGGLASLA